MRSQTKKEVLTTGQIARICKVAPRTVAKWFDTGELHGYRIPGSRDRRVPIKELVQFMRAHGLPLEALSPDRASVVVLDPQEAPDAGATPWRSAFQDHPDVELQIASTAFEAGFLIARLDPRLVFLDVDAAGLDLTLTPSLIRRESAESPTMLLAFGAPRSDDLARALLDAGFHGWLPRPVNVNDLRSFLQRP
ncbi:MAG: hypothetical protein FLDDKLPJ_02705 [Phycisphaerae bacterium]|nr:hypothetical protein [Phycisphaerae bacterium]